jgi:two-component system, cell cycle sensor histidine kinase and response regulator CckA
LTSSPDGQSTRLLDSVLENMGHGIAVYDDANKLLVHNRRFAEMYDLTPDALTPGTHRDTVPKVSSSGIGPATRKRPRRFWARA